SDADFQKTKDIMALSDELIFICVDIANGYSEHLVEYVERVRAEFPDKVISAGNVVTGDMCEALILAGADIVKVGLGPG
ncbi:IMP dehydrogenase, partial [Escherichia coli]|nr:IMP dehydrogenase [Escherichia coli]